jgi:putative DNA primase/helicase
VTDTQFSDTHKFLTALFGNIEKGNIYLWTMPDKRTWSFSVDDLKIMINAAQAMQDERDVYYGLGGSMQEIEATERIKPNNVSFIPCLWMDIDIATPGAHVQTDLPKTAQEALSVLPEFLQPSIVVHSGNGLHVYWLLKEAWIFEAPEDNLRASNLMIRLQAYIKQLAQERGWKLDSTADLSRVLRVPGTLNHKRGQKQSVRIMSFSDDIRYDPSELEDLIPDIDFRAAITGNHGSFERRSTDASADLMISNCQFLQHCSLHASTITYGEWLSMLTNVVRGTEGIDKCHELSSSDKGRYTPKGTDFRLSEALKMNPHTCDYIKANHSFSCPAGGCGVKSPCSFSLGRIDQARAKVNMLGIPSTDKIFNPDMLSALSIIKRNDAALYARTKDKLKGTVGIRDLENAIKQHTQSITNSEVAEIQCSEVSGVNEEQLQNLTKEGYTINAFGELCNIKYDQDKKPYLVKLSNFIAWPVREIERTSKLKGYCPVLES